MKNHMQTGRMTKMAIFNNSRWQMANILKIALCPYLSRELSGFDQIWNTEVNFHSKDGHLTKKIKILQFKMAERCHIENLFLAIPR